MSEKYDAAAILDMTDVARAAEALNLHTEVYPEIATNGMYRLLTEVVETAPEYDFGVDGDAEDFTLDSVH